MSQNESMGFIETVGIATAIQAADVMVKSANVKVETVANADAGLITVICKGDLASCTAAVDSAKAAISVTGTCFNSNQIPRPSSDVDVLIKDHVGNMIRPPKPIKKTKTSKK
ncbi:BMC domain-containing protein [Desulfospira joergensenii]|uniref:BMC domain-containing protein n=1 Tax=Desulfospira joergensenii TaxID=53329 RepID=UPI0003B6D28D|nr:BMC domain-containing protein [Desulfospira joergensenii]